MKKKIQLPPSLMCWKGLPLINSRCCLSSRLAKKKKKVPLKESCEESYLSSNVKEVFFFLNDIFSGNTFQHSVP